MARAGCRCERLEQRARGAAEQAHGLERRRADRLEPRIAALECTELALHVGEQRAHRVTAIAGELAADEIVRLDAGGALVDGRDAHVAHVLRGARLLDEAHAAVHLHADGGDLVADLGAPALDDRCQELTARACRVARALVLGVLGQIELKSAVEASARARLGL